MNISGSMRIYATSIWELPPKQIDLPAVPLNVDSDGVLAYPELEKLEIKDVSGSTT